MRTSSLRDNKQREMFTILEGIKNKKLQQLLVNVEAVDHMMNVVRRLSRRRVVWAVSLAVEERELVRQG